MQKKHTSSLLLFSLVTPLSFADEIKIFTWEEYFSPQVIAAFEEQSGHTVSQIYFESEMLRDMVVYSGKATAYDLFIIDGYTLDILSGKGLIRKFDDALLANDSNTSIDASEACGQYGVPYSYGTIGIGYRSSKVKSELTSWMDVFEYAKQAPGSVVMPSEDLDTTAIALMALGYHPMSNDEVELKEAYLLLDSVVDDLLAFRNSAGYAMDKAEQSKMDVAIYYSGETEQISNATGQDDWVYSIPDDGTLIWYECLSAHADKPMSEATRAFVNFINTPANAAKNAQDMWFATINRGALKLADEEYLSDVELFPKNLSDINAYQYKNISPTSLKMRADMLSVLLKD